MPSVGVCIQTAELPHNSFLSSSKLSESAVRQQACQPVFLSVSYSQENSLSSHQSDNLLGRVAARCPVRQIKQSLEDYNPKKLHLIPAQMTNGSSQKTTQSCLPDLSRGQLLESMMDCCEKIFDTPRSSESGKTRQRRCSIGESRFHPVSTFHSEKSLNGCVLNNRQID